MLKSTINRFNAEWIEIPSRIIKKTKNWTKPGKNCQSKIVCEALVIEWNTYTLAHGSERRNRRNDLKTRDLLFVYCTATKSIPWFWVCSTSFDCLSLSFASSCVFVCPVRPDWSAWFFCAACVFNISRCACDLIGSSNEQLHDSCFVSEFSFHHHHLRRSSRCCCCCCRRCFGRRFCNLITYATSASVFCVHVFFCVRRLKLYKSVPV